MGRPFLFPVKEASKQKNSFNFQKLLNIASETIEEHIPTN